MKKIVALILTALSLTANALPKDSDLWTVASAGANGTQYSILNGSPRVLNNDNGMPVIAVTGRSISKDGDTNSALWYVPIEHCATGKGIFVITDLSGKQTGQLNFAFGLGTVASQISEIMCTIAEQIVNEKPTKSPTKKPQTGNGPLV